MIRWKTHPDLINLVLTALIAEVAPNQLETLLTNDPWVALVISEQTSLGWHLVKLGILSKEWRKCQAQYERHALPTASNKNGVRWAHRMQQGLWDYTSGAWENRNAEVHGRTLEDEQRIRHQKVDQTVESILRSHPKVGHEYTHLLTNFETLKTKPYSYKVAWTKQIQTAIRKENIRRRREWAESSAAARTQALHRATTNRSVVEVRRQTKIQRYSLK